MSTAQMSLAKMPTDCTGAAELPERLDAVLTVIHLVFTTGHKAPAGESLVRDELVEQAIMLARMVAGLMPDEREALGLLALLVLTHARRATRTDSAGRLLLMSEQDRSRWDQAAIAEGGALARDAMRGPARPGRFAAQAAIAAVHAQAPDYAQTDWPLLVARYYVLTTASLAAGLWDWLTHGTPAVWEPA